MLVLLQLDAVVAVVCFGSTVLGTGDVQSDIDLLVLCDPAIPPVHRRQSHFEQHAALSELVLDAHPAGWDTPWAPQTDTLALAQQRYDVSYNTPAWLTQLVHAVRTTGATSLPAMPFRPYTVLGLLATAVILYDPHDIARNLVNQTQPYPPHLKTQLLDEFVPILQLEIQGSALQLSLVFVPNTSHCVPYMTSIVARSGTRPAWTRGTCLIAFPCVQFGHCVTFASWLARLG